MAAWPGKHTLNWATAVWIGANDDDTRQMACAHRQAPQQKG